MKKLIRVLLLLFLIAWMLLIFSLSAETATESSDKSGGFSYKIAALFVPDFEEMSEAEQQEILEKMSFPVRKSAHFCIFAVLSVLTYFNVYFLQKPTNSLKYALSFGFSAIYAASDEFHQRFVEGRSCELRDWLIDCSGVAVGLLFCFILLLIVKKCNGKKQIQAGRIMRKKELINENRFISEELKRLKENNEALKEELDGKSEEIKLLNEKIEKLNEALSSKGTEKDIESLKETEPIEQIPNILDYGAVIIGKVLLSAAEYCGRISSQNEERVNAAVEDIFERTEAVKSEILSIISTDDSYDKKSQLMEREYHAAVSFFDRTVARV